MAGKFTSLLVCTLCLAGLLALWVFIESGNLERMTHGLPLTFEIPASLEDARALLGGQAEAATESSAPFVALVFVILLVFDAHAVFQRYANHRRVRQPADNPLGFALLRLRRYLLVPIAIGWLMAYCRATGLEAKVSGQVLFVVGVILARRGEDDTYFNMFQYACECASKFCEGFSGHR